MKEPKQQNPYKYLIDLLEKDADSHRADGASAHEELDRLYATMHECVCRALAKELKKNPTMTVDEFGKARANLLKMADQALNMLFEARALPPEMRQRCDDYIMSTLGAFTKHYVEEAEEVVKHHKREGEETKRRGKRNAMEWGLIAGLAIGVAGINMYGRVRQQEAMRMWQERESVNRIMHEDLLQKYRSVVALPAGEEDYQFQLLKPPPQGAQHVSPQDYDSVVIILGPHVHQTPVNVEQLKQIYRDKGIHNVTIVGNGANQNVTNAQVQEALSHSIGTTLCIVNAHGTHQDFQKFDGTPTTQHTMSLAVNELGETTQYDTSNNMMANAYRMKRDPGAIDFYFCSCHSYAPSSAEAMNIPGNRGLVCYTSGDEVLAVSSAARFLNTLGHNGSLNRRDLLADFMLTDYMKSYQMPVISIANTGILIRTSTMLAQQLGRKFTIEERKKLDQLKAHFSQIIEGYHYFTNENGSVEEPFNTRFDRVVKAIEKGYVDTKDAGFAALLCTHVTMGHQLEAYREIDQRVTMAQKFKLAGLPDVNMTEGFSEDWKQYFDEQMRHFKESQAQQGLGGHSFGR